MFLIDCLRLFATAIGYVVLSLYLLGCIEVGDFYLSFSVK